MARTSGELDITDGRAVLAEISSFRPDVIVNAAGYTDVDGAEDEIGRAIEVNATALTDVGRAARVVGAVVVHFGSDYVFDGGSQRPYCEGDPTNPLDSYGKSKLAGERALAASGAEFTIVRTQWLFGIGGRCFPRTMWERARAGKKTRVVDDQFGRPSYAPDVAEATWSLVVHRAANGELMVREPRGIVHVANWGVASWFDVAERVFSAGGVPELLERCKTAEFPTKARRPAWSVLDTTKYEQLVGRRTPPWENAIDRYLGEMAAIA